MSDYKPKGLGGWLPMADNSDGWKEMAEDAQRHFFNLLRDSAETEKPEEIENQERYE